MVRGKSSEVHGEVLCNQPIDGRCHRNRAKVQGGEVTSPFGDKVEVRISKIPRDLRIRGDGIIGEGQVQVLEHSVSDIVEEEGNTIRPWGRRVLRGEGFAKFFYIYQGRGGRGGEKWEFFMRILPPFSGPPHRLSFFFFALPFPLSLPLLSFPFSFFPRAA